jgi:hypothetical protein
MMPYPYLTNAYRIDRWLDARDEHDSDPEPDTPCRGTCNPEGCLADRCCVDAGSQE